MKLKALLNQRDITLTKLCEDTGITMKHLSRLQNGKARCGMVAARKIAVALDIGIDELMNGEEPVSIKPVRRKRKR